MINFLIFVQSLEMKINSFKVLQNYYIIYILKKY